MFAVNYSAQLFSDLTGSFLKMYSVEINSQAWDESDSTERQTGINGFGLFMGSVDIKKT